MACLLAGSFAAHAQPLPSLPTRSAPAKPASVAGTVTNAFTKQPIAHATVYLDEFQQHFAYTATTDASGQFHLDNVKAGDNYAINAERPGFAMDSPRVSLGPSGIRVAEGQHLSGVAVRLMPLGAVAGRVLDAQGSPIPAIDVVLFVRGYTNGESQLRAWKPAKTDDRGAYRFFDIEPGTYFVRAIPHPDPTGVNLRVHSDRPEQLYAETFYGVSPGPPGAIEMAPGAEVTGIDFHLGEFPAYHIRGKIVDAAGKPVAAYFTILPCQDAGMNFSLGPSAPLRPESVFDSGSLAPGSYCLNARAVNPPVLRSPQQVVELKDHDLDVTLTVKPGVAVRGRVELDGAVSASGIQVSLTPAAGAPAATVRPDHTFLLLDINTGKYQLHVSNGAYLKSITVGGHPVPDSAIDVTASGADLVLRVGTDTGSIDVTVESADSGVPQFVFATPVGHPAFYQDQFRMVFTPPRETARLQNLAPGEYNVFAWEAAELDLARVPAFLELLHSHATAVTVHSRGHESAQVKLTTVEEIDAAKTRFH